MLNNIFSQKQYGSDAKAMTSSFFVSVYTYMFVALGISGSIAYLCGTGEQVLLANGRSLPIFFVKYFITSTGGLSPLFYIVSFAPVGLGLLLQMAYTRLSLPVLLVIFAVYSILMGLSLSVIFIIFDIGSIFSTFFVTAGAFGAMAILGYVTKIDLTKFGSLLYMVFIGIFIAAVVNMFVGSDMIDFWISVIGVFVFTGLTAYEMQQLKYINEDPNLGDADKKKLALVGGVRLYILFINLFISLLRLLGNRN